MKKLAKKSTPKKVSKLKVSKTKMPKHSSQKSPAPKLHKSKKLKSRISAFQGGIVHANSAVAMSSKKTPGDKMEVLRLQTGIEGFDELIDGGIPENSFTLVSGGTGTGKSIFCINFLASGAAKGEPGVYVSLEEGYNENKRQMDMFGWGIEKLQKEGKMLILQPKIYNFEKLIESIQDAIDSIGAKRLVLDSISVFEVYFEDQFKTRRNILDLARTLKEMGVTTLAISETTDEVKGMSRHGVEEFLSDGVIILYLTKRGNTFSRAVSIRKMRATNHSLKIHPIEIKPPNGIVVYPFEEVFNEIK